MDKEGLVCAWPSWPWSMPGHCNVSALYMCGESCSILHRAQIQKYIQKKQHYNLHRQWHYLHLCLMQKTDQTCAPLTALYQKQTKDNLSLKISLNFNNLLSFGHYTIKKLASDGLNPRLLSMHSRTWALSKPIWLHNKCA